VSVSYSHNHSPSSCYLPPDNLDFSTTSNENLEISETTMQPATNPSRLPAFLLFLHGTQLILAVVITSLTAYELHFVDYNVLFFCLTVVSGRKPLKRRLRCLHRQCICTIVVCIYILSSVLCFPKLYSRYIVLAYHLSVTFFWIVTLGLVAHLASLWQGSTCLYTHPFGSTCTPYDERGVSILHKSDNTSYKTYYGALVAESVLSAFEV
jgi:hypothetical protein